MSSLDAPGAEGLRAAFAKIESAEPLFRVGLGFVPVDSRAAFMAWTALLGELRECAFALSDPRVTAVKAGWWAEELDGVARGAARHPLTRVLARHGGPWRGVGDALLTVAGDDAPSADLAATIDALRRFADPLIAVEHHLFGARVDAALPAQALALHWLRTRLECGLEASDRARVPLALFARHGLRRDQLSSDLAAPLRRDWATALRDALPISTAAGWSYPRLLTVVADQRALEALIAGGAAPRGASAGFLDVWRAWRLARNAALRVMAPVTAST